jgi:cell division protease FtsH
VEHNQNNNQNNNNPFGKNMMVWVLIVLLLAGVFNMFNKNQAGLSAGATVAYSDFVTAVEEKKITDVVISGNIVRGHYTDGKNFAVYLPNGADIVSRLEGTGVRITGAPDKSDSPSFFGVLLSWFPMLLLIGVWIFFMRQMQGGGNKAMGFGKSKAKMLTEKSGRLFKRSSQVSAPRW